MKTVNELFEDKDEVASFHDCVVEALSWSYEQGKALTPETLRKVFDALPEHVRDVAHSWGMSDTPFRDDAFVFIRHHPVEFSWMRPA